VCPCWVVLREERRRGKEGEQRKKEGVGRENERVIVDVLC
jgi:hypothetical protein